MDKFERIIIPFWTILIYVGVVAARVAGDMSADGFWICLILLGMWTYKLAGIDYGKE